MDAEFFDIVLTSLSNNVIKMHRTNLIRLLHTRFAPVPPTKAQKHKRAVDALLAFNVMVRQQSAAQRKASPSERRHASSRVTAAPIDVITYTRLIRIMAEGGLEWQAYKLFARMIDHGITPMPETYVALRAATSPQRHRLLQALEEKIQEATLSYPNEVAKEFEHLESAVRANIDKEITLLKQPGGIRELLQLEKEQRAGRGEDDGEKDEESNGDTSKRDNYVTVSIDTPQLTWDVFKHAMEERRRGALNPTAANTPGWLPDDDEVLRTRLNKMDEAELRTFLTLCRQLRHGDKDALVSRIIEHVPLKEVQSMLQRREEYYKHLRLQIEEVMEELKKDEARAAATAVVPHDDHSALFPDPHPTEGMLSPVEREQMKPASVQTPWGVVQKPVVMRDVAKPQRNSHRDIAPTEEEEKMIEDAVASQTLDLVPAPTLRKYARHYEIAWKRRVSGNPMSGGDLYSAITFFVSNKDKLLRPDVPEGYDDLVELGTRNEDRHTYVENVAPVAPTAFDVINAASRYALETQVVDDKETNLARFAENRRAKREERMENVRITPSLAASGLLTAEDVKHRELLVPHVDRVKQREGTQPSLHPEEVLRRSLPSYKAHRKNMLLGEASSSSSEVPEWSSTESQFLAETDAHRDGVWMETGAQRFHQHREKKVDKIKVAQRALESFTPENREEHHYKRRKSKILALRDKMNSKKEEDRKKKIVIPKKKRMMWKV